MSPQKSDAPAHTSQESSTVRDHTVPSDTVQHASKAVAFDAYASPQVYYGSTNASRKVAKSRTLSLGVHNAGNFADRPTKPPGRRSSQDARGDIPLKFLVDVDETLHTLLDQEDSDRNWQITVDDHGPKTIQLRTAASGGYHRTDIRGTYMLGNLLAELTLAQQHGRRQVVIDESRLNENPVSRLARSIQDIFWPNLTRRIDGSNVLKVASDPKDWTKDPRPRIYIPRGVPEYFEYYQRIAREHPEARLDVRWLDPCAADESVEADNYVRDLNQAPGLLAIALERIADTPNGEPDFKGVPFVVPGGRFNELYGWDSYMETLGLLINGRDDLCEGMVKNFCFSIKHYGKILNANRSYYLRRSQPPFLTDMAIRVYGHISHKPYAKDFLREATLAAIRDYYNTWMSAPRYDPQSGLSRYHPGGRGVPPETEATHFIHVLKPYADRYGLTFEQFVHAYDYGHIDDLDESLAEQWVSDQKELDEYFRHDRAIRESGHDTSYRLERVAANLATVDLNSCLYKYEIDIARLIDKFFDGQLHIPPEWLVKGRPRIESSAAWDRAAAKRRATMKKLMWDEDAGMFFDYNTVTKEPTGYESATTFWAMWAGACTPKQANIMVEKALPKFEELGGLVSGTEKSRGKIDKHRPNRQWDYPFGWAPQQILAWIGLERFGYQAEAARLAYRWIYMVTKASVDYNGVVVEKYDVTQPQHPHKVTAEYGNQGGDFKGAATEGFGWVNASYIYGLTLLDGHMKRALGAITPWDTFKLKTGHLDTPPSEHTDAHEGDVAPKPQQRPTFRSHASAYTATHAVLDAHKGRNLEPVNGSHARNNDYTHDDVNLGSTAQAITASP